MSSQHPLPSAPGTVFASDAGLWANLVVMWRVIFALMMRDSRTRYGKHDIGYLWAIIEPMIELIVLIVVYTLMFRKIPVPNTSGPVFFSSGILAYTFWRSSVTRGASAALSNRPLLEYPQVKVMDVVISRVLLDFATMIVVYLIFIIGLHFVTGEPFSSWVGDPLQLVFSFMALFYFSFGFAVFSCSLARIFPLWNEIFRYMSRPLWFTSGVFFTLTELSKGLRAYASYNPVAHVMEWIKVGMLPAFHSTAYSPFFVLTVATLTLFFGLVIEWMWRLTGHVDEQQ